MPYRCGPLHRHVGGKIPYALQIGLSPFRARNPVIAVLGQGERSGKQECDKTGQCLDFHRWSRFNRFDEFGEGISLNVGGGHVNAYADRPGQGPNAGRHGRLFSPISMCLAAAVATLSTKVTESIAEGAIFYGKAEQGMIESFDTLASSRRLRKSGMPMEQADATVEVVSSGRQESGNQGVSGFTSGCAGRAVGRALRQTRYEIRQARCKNRQIGRRVGRATSPRYAWYRTVASRGCRCSLRGVDLLRYFRSDSRVAGGNSAIRRNTAWRESKANSNCRPVRQRPSRA